MNARAPLGFQRPPFPFQKLQEPNLEVMMEKYAYGATKKEEYIKEFTSKVDVLTTHNSMLEA